MRIGHLILSGGNRLYREALRQVVESESVSVVGDAPSLIEAAAMLKSVDRSVNLMVCCEPIGSHEWTVAQQIATDFPEVAVIMLTERVTSEGLKQAVKVGVRGFVPHDISPAALQALLCLILVDENIFAAPAGLSGAIASTRAPDLSPVYEDIGPRLSAREAQILSCIQKGLPNKVIARDLDMPEATVKVHLKSVLRKINVQNRTQAAIWAMKHRYDHGAARAVAAC